MALENEIGEAYEPTPAQHSGLGRAAHATASGIGTGAKYAIGGALGLPIAAVALAIGIPAAIGVGLWGVYGLAGGAALTGALAATAVAGVAIFTLGAPAALGAGIYGLFKGAGRSVAETRMDNAAYNIELARAQAAGRMQAFAMMQQAQPPVPQPVHTPPVVSPSPVAAEGVIANDNVSLGKRRDDAMDTMVRTDTKIDRASVEPQGKEPFKLGHADALAMSAANPQPALAAL